VAAEVGLGAGDAVVAGGAVRFVGEAARPVAVAGAGVLALVGRGARVRAAGAAPRGAHVVLGAGDAVVAGAAVGLVGEAAAAIAVAGAGVLALARRGAGVGGAGAGPRGAHVVLAAGDAVVADGAVGLVGEAAGPVAV